MIKLASARVVFAGTPDFAVPSLQALVDAGVTIDSVLTQPDRRAGRGRHLAQSPIKQLAIRCGIEVLQPTRLDDALLGRLSEEGPDLLVVAAYGRILPQWMLDWPRIAAVNVHASLLPRWRGAAPIQHAVLAGDDETGISIMRMTAGLDCGPVYRQQTIRIGLAETAGELHDRLAALGAGLLLETLPGILAATLKPEEQNESGANYASRIEKRDAVLNWELSAVELGCRVRAYNPWPVAEARTADGTRLRIWQAEAVSGELEAKPGAIVAAASGAIDVATADGLLRLKRVQSPGGRVMSADAYLAAHDLRGIHFVGPD